MQLIEPAVCSVSVAEGRLVQATARYTKALSDLRGQYEDEAAFEAALAVGDRIVYEVTDFRPSDAAGDLIFGVTRMSPGLIGEEFFLTRGHIHAIGNRPEIYYGESGHGVMVLESPQGDVRNVAINPGDICYVPPYWIHRSANVGEDELVMTFCYPADSGQDYDIIARSGGMRNRIVSDGSGGWTAIANKRWTPRSEAEIAAVFATGTETTK